MSLLVLKDLFARHRARATGLWRLGQEPGRTIFMESGDVVFAVSTHPLDRLTHLLVERGKITQAQLDYAMANLNPAMSIGKNLIEMGFITQRDLLDVARAQVERVVWASLASLEGTPTFEAKDLDATTVRLPFDTAAMLLAGVLGLKDRERVLEELGPLNQVVVLEGRRHQDLALPPDLMKLPILLDGSRTLLELSREAGVEPFRLGAFVLFLREMGWARLHELPPLDRHALELALDTPEAVLSQTLPDPAPAPQTPLFAEIHASQLPTTNLDHLSEALDQLGADDEVELEDPFPPEPEPLVAGEPALPIHHQATEGSTERLEPPTAPESPASTSRRPAILLSLLIMLALGWFGLSRYRRSPTPKAKPAQEATKPATEATPPGAPKVDPPVTPKAETTTPAPEPTKAEPAKPEPSKPEPARAPEPAPVKAAPAKPEVTAVPSKADRLQAITQGNWKLALAQGAAQRKALQGRWSLRLEIACQGSTVQHAADLMKAQDPDLFLVPMAMRDGRTCYQVFVGSFGSEAAAKAAAKRLPAPFLAEGNRPKPFRVAQIPDRQ
ncbi:MAG: DnaJ-class molecular chaperone with C-terminal Zn finger domain [Holophagaceae bacterium]|nr:DnaJ-class molecular chaperone with C-terminal Zn finger domain [Holophagaceae bacterium]